MVGSARRPMLIMAAAALVTLLVALVNLALLGLVRGSERQAELSIRDALGAGPFRLRRQLFTEHLLISVCGVACGLALAKRLVVAAVGSQAVNLPRAGAVRFDAPVWWAAAVVAILAALVLTIQPLRVRASMLRTGAWSVGRTVRHSRRFMAAAEMALALTLATGGASLALSFSRLLSTDPGFDPGGAAAVRVSAYAGRHPAKDDVVRLFDGVIARMKTLPQVSAVAAGSTLPLSGQLSGTSVVALGKPVLPGSRPTAGWAFVTPGYVNAVGMHLRADRDFSSADRQRPTHVAIINEDLARLLFPGEDPIGRRIGVGGGDSQNDWHEVIGVVADVRHQSLDLAPTPRVYDLFGQHWDRTLFVVARTSPGEEAALLDALRRTVRAADADAPVFEGATLTDLVNRSVAPRQLASTFAVGLASAAVLLALIGVYAVSAATVAERAKEIGVRAALGASPRDLFRLIAREGAWTAIAGGITGLFGSTIVVRLLQAHLFGVRPTDALWLVPAVSLAVLCAATLAAVPSARRAASSDPLAVIRAD